MCFKSTEPYSSVFWKFDTLFYATLMLLNNNKKGKRSSIVLPSGPQGLVNE
jgi:hypothetical protein